jgi:hypothetical protein
VSGLYSRRRRDTTRIRRHADKDHKERDRIMGVGEGQPWEEKKRGSAGGAWKHCTNNITHTNKIKQSQKIHKLTNKSKTKTKTKTKHSHTHTHTHTRTHTIANTQTNREGDAGRERSSKVYVNSKKN